MTGKTSFWEDPHNQETPRLLVLLFFITFSIANQIVFLLLTVVHALKDLISEHVDNALTFFAEFYSNFWPGQMYFLNKFTKHIQTWPPTNVFVRETSLKNRVSTNYC